MEENVTRDEMETIVVFNALSKSVNIYTTYPPHVRAIENDERYTVTREHFEGGERIGIDAEIPANAFHPLKGAKRRQKPLTEDQRAALVERLNSVRTR